MSKTATTPASETPATEAPKGTTAIDFSALATLDATAFVSDKAREAMIPDESVVKLLKEHLTEPGKFVVLPVADEETLAKLKKEFLKAAKWLDIRIQSTVGMVGETKAIKYIRTQTEAEKAEAEKAKA